MLSREAAKAALSKRGLSRRHALLIGLAVWENPISMSKLRETLAQLGYKIPKTCNPTTELRRASHLARLLPNGWEITNAGLDELLGEHSELTISAFAEPLEHLRSHANSISDPDRKAFVMEAVECCERGLFRSAIVMSWLAAIYVLQSYIVENAEARNDFNRVLRTANKKNKLIRVRDDFRHYKESVQIDYFVNSKVISSSVAKELRTALDRRNNCGHPSNVVYDQHTVASLLEVLLQNVFLKF